MISDRIVFDLFSVGRFDVNHQRQLEHDRDRRSYNHGDQRFSRR
jgi:hypothetical protein